jgi:hypothetical protein
MKTAIAMLCVAACFSTPIFAQEKTATTQDLVKAAKDAKAKRKQSSSKVITNKDVKTSKGKLIVLNTPAAKTPAVKTETAGPLEKQDATFRQRKEAQARIDVAQKKVDDLQKELDAIEQRYYEENDPTYRDQVIQQRFAQTKRQLDDARHELADARDALKNTDSSK